MSQTSKQASVGGVVARFCLWALLGTVGGVAAMLSIVGLVWAIGWLFVMLITSIGWWTVPVLAGMVVGVVCGVIGAGNYISANHESLEERYERRLRKAAGIDEEFYRSNR